MAEIKIRKKRPVWIWVVLLLIIIGALVYYLSASEQFDTDDNGSRMHDEQMENSTVQYEDGLPITFGKA